MLLFEFRAIFNVKSAGVAWLPVCPFADNKRDSAPRAGGIISKKRGVMSIADTLTTAAEAYLEKLSDVVKKPDFSITWVGLYSPNWLTASPRYLLQITTVLMLTS